MADLNVEAEFERVNGRINVLTAEVSAIKEWLPISRQFHQDMRTWKDTWDGAQEAEKKARAAELALQQERHQSNSFKLNLLMLIVAAFTGIAIWATWLHPSGHSFLEIPQKLAPMRWEYSVSRLPTTRPPAGAKLSMAFAKRAEGLKSLTPLACIAGYRLV